MLFKVGDRVRWTSQAGGYVKSKEGIVAQVVPAGEYPERSRFLHLYKSAGVGKSRDHESYVVVVGHKPYWPLANKLQPVEEVQREEGYRRVAFDVLDPLLRKFLNLEGAFGLLKSPPWPSYEEIKDAHRKLMDAMSKDSKS